MPTARTALALSQPRGALQCKANIGGLGGIVQAPGVAEATSCANQRVPKQAWALNVLLLHEAGLAQARMGGESLLADTRHKQSCLCGRF